MLTKTIDLDTLIDSNMNTKTPCTPGEKKNFAKTQKTQHNKHNKHNKHTKHTKVIEIICPKSLYNFNNPRGKFFIINDF